MEADYPGAIVVEAATYGYSYKNDPKAWCLHTPEELADDNPVTPYYFHNLTGRRASTTYFVSYTGLVFQCVPELEGAYANARQDVAGWFDWETPNWNLNLETLSIELEGFAHNIHQTMVRGGPQWNATVRLMAHRCKARNFPPERTFGHYQVSNQRSDPGKLDIAQLVLDVKHTMKGDEMFLVKATPSNRIFLIGPEGKRYIKTVDELSVYSKRLEIDVWADTVVDKIPDFA